MILIEIFQSADEAPSIYEVSQPHLLRLAVVEAYRAGGPVPMTVTDAARYLRQHSTTLLAFYDIEEASDWVAGFTGPNHSMLKSIVQDYMITQYMT